MSPTEVIPLLIVVLLLLSASGTDVDRMDVVFDGEHDATEIEDALVVGGGTVTIPADANATGTVYVIGGDARIAGHLDGDVTVLAGNLSVADGATVTGQLQTVAGQASVAEGATVGERTSVEVATGTQSPTAGYASLAIRTLVLALVGGWFARRRPALLRNVGDAIAEHALVSGVVGSLAGATLLVLFVYMAFTLVLLPVSILGLVAELLAVVYGYLAYGYLIGRRLPVERVDVASAAGVAVFVLGVELLGEVPYLGVLVEFGLVAVGFGAVLLTYFGLRAFEPAELPT